MSDFPTTAWSVIRDAARSAPAAQTDLVERYRPAVVRFARKRGVDAAEAEDVAQEVFLGVLDPRLLERADAARGRFRSLVLAITAHVISRRLEHRNAQRRGGGRAPVSLEGADLGARLEDLVTSRAREPEFDREWLAALLSGAFRKLREANDGLHDCLHAFVVEGLTHAEIARRLGRTEASVRNAISRGRQRLAAILRREVARYASSEVEFEDEVRYLQELMQPREG